MFILGQNNSSNILPHETKLADCFILRRSVKQRANVLLWYLKFCGVKVESDLNFSGADTESKK